MPTEQQKKDRYRDALYEQQKAAEERKRRTRVGNE